MSHPPLFLLKGELNEYLCRYLHGDHRTPARSLAL